MSIQSETNPGPVGDFDCCIVQTKPDTDLITEARAVAENPQEFTNGHITSTLVRAAKALESRNAEVSTLREVIEKGETRWMEGGRNDGEFEYAESSDCDGSHIAYFRRSPEKLIASTGWEKVDAIPESARYWDGREYLAPAVASPEGSTK